MKDTLPWTACDEALPEERYDEDGAVNAVVGALKPELISECEIPFTAANATWFRKHGPEHCSFWMYLEPPKSDQLPWHSCNVSLPDERYDERGKVNTVVGYFRPEMQVDYGIPFMTADATWFRQHGPRHCSHWIYL